MANIIVLIIFLLLEAFYIYLDIKRIKKYNNPCPLVMDIVFVVFVVGAYLLGL